MCWYFKAGGLYRGTAKIVIQRLPLAYQRRYAPSRAVGVVFDQPLRRGREHPKLHRQNERTYRAFLPYFVISAWDIMVPHCEPRTYTRSWTRLCTYLRDTRKTREAVDAEGSPLVSGSPPCCVPLNRLPWLAGTLCREGLFRQRPPYAVNTQEYLCFTVVCFRPEHGMLPSRGASYNAELWESLVCLKLVF